MQVSIEYGPGNAAARVGLNPGESFTAEGGSMIAMSGDLTMETTTRKREGGGILQAAGRMLAGENFFLNHYTAGENAGEVWLSTTLPGDMMTYDLQPGQSLIVQAGSYVASEPGIDVKVGWQGFKSMFSGESMFWLNLKGENDSVGGQLVLSSYGCIYPVEIPAEGQYIVDTGHIVAFSETLDFSISKAGKSWFSSFLGGEGLVCKFRSSGAPGTVWCQSHNPNSFGQILGPKLKPR